MRFSILVLFLATAALVANSADAQESCDAATKAIDDRLSQPGYTEFQRQQGQQLKQIMAAACVAGGPEAVAMMVSQLDMILPPPAQAFVEQPAESEAVLTAEYLAGQWCRGGQEASSYDFAPDGSFRVAVVGLSVTAEGAFYLPEVMPMAEFLNQVGDVVSKDADRFSSERGRVFTRGACEFMTNEGTG